MSGFAELRQQGPEWPPYKAGLFGSNFDVFKKAKTKVDEKAFEISMGLGSA